MSKIEIRHFDPLLTMHSYILCRLRFIFNQWITFYNVFLFAQSFFRLMVESEIMLDGIQTCH